MTKDVDKTVYIWSLKAMEAVQFYSNVQSYRYYHFHGGIATNSCMVHCTQTWWSGNRKQNPLTDHNQSNAMVKSRHTLLVKDLTRHPIKGKHGNPHSDPMATQDYRSCCKQLLVKKQRKGGEGVGLVEYPWFPVWEEADEVVDRDKGHRSGGPRLLTPTNTSSPVIGATTADWRVGVGAGQDRAGQGRVAARLVCHILFRLVGVIVQHIEKRDLFWLYSIVKEIW